MELEKSAGESFIQRLFEPRAVIANYFPNSPTRISSNEQLAHSKRSFLHAGLIWFSLWTNCMA
jgi:hypothetical protein